MKMTYSSSIAAAGAMLTLVGCASAPNVAVREPVGPAPTGQVGAIADGQLQVYSARQRAPVDLNVEEFLWNNDFGKNDFLYEAAHTGYSIFTRDGTLLQRVSNARSWNDGQPTLVALAAGCYKIEAEVEGDNGVSLVADVPVVIKAGQTTVVHLGRDWKPSSAPPDKHALVQAFDGRFIGWRGQCEEIASHP
jgi:hypothetical protein